MNPIIIEDEITFESFLFIGMLFFDLDAPYVMPPNNNINPIMSNAFIFIYFLVSI